MELTFVAAVNDIWKLQSSWMHHYKVCDQGRRVKSSLLPSFFRKSWNCWKKKLKSSMPNSGSIRSDVLEVGTIEKILKYRTLIGAL